MTLIRFHLDEHVPKAIAVGSRRRNIDVTTAQEAGLSGASDTDQIAFACAQGRVIVTHDCDFAQHHAQRVKHAGMVYCHQDKYGVGELLSLLVVLHGVMTAEEAVGVLEFL